ncbi:MAG: glycerol-3-phosphate 1-O-acyltransferase PlsY [Ktedonobacterales bacterium]
MSVNKILLRLLGVGIAGYLLGSVPNGVLIGKVYGVDPRTKGSQRTGATNVLRLLGRGPAVAVAALDAGKGAASVYLARSLFTQGHPELKCYADWADAVGTLTALVGHNHSIFIRFKGGRGVLTGAGAMAMMSPIAWACACIAAVVPIAVTRYVSLGSIMGAAAAPAADLVLVLRCRDSAAHLLGLALGGGYVIYSHKDNIQRLLNGTERKLGERTT